MTQNGNPYENALAERMNTTLKDEFGLGSILRIRQQAYVLAAEAIHLYNSGRPHFSLGLKTSDIIHS